MGVWGTAIFDDDLALDLKDEYRELLAEGHRGPEATQILLERWQSEITDPDLEPVFWLSLAATQWQVGRLEEPVKNKALEIIDAGTDLVRWQDDPYDWKKRQHVLAKLRRQLESPQPQPQKIRQAYRSSCEWGVGEIIAFRLLSGKLILLRLLGLSQDKGGISPTCELLDWVGEVIPPIDILETLPVRRIPLARTDEKLRELGVTESSLHDLEALTGSSITWEDLRQPQPQFTLCRTKEKELPVHRLQRLGISFPPSRQPGIARVVFWRNLDTYLEEVFGLT